MRSRAETASSMCLSCVSIAPPTPAICDPDTGGGGMQVQLIATAQGSVEWTWEGRGRETLPGTPTPAPQTGPGCSSACEQH